LYRRHTRNYRKYEENNGGYGLEAMIVAKTFPVAPTATTTKITIPSPTTPQKLSPFLDYSVEGYLFYGPASHTPALSRQPWVPRHPL